MANLMLGATLLTLATTMPRQDCDSIRGTQYQFDEERDFFLTHCVGTRVVNWQGRSCEEIRGTEYWDGNERAYFLSNCLNWRPYGNNALALIRDCESGGDYSATNPNGWYGAYQFDLGTWQSVGGIGFPHHASPQEQDLRAQILFEQRGVHPWTNCAIKKGLL